MEYLVVFEKIDNDSGRFIFKVRKFPTLREAELYAEALKRDSQFKNVNLL